MPDKIKIPTGKVERASKVIGAGAKVGKNYLGYYSKKMIGSDVSKESLHEKNAKDISNSLKELKGPAMKVAQMMAMDKNIVPETYAKEFSLTQYKVPPISFPLVAKTIRDQLGSHPSQIFETFTQEAMKAASMGQVHQAKKNGVLLAVKVQYPGVEESVRSDIRLLKPLASRLFKVTSKEIDFYLDEVQEKLLEETNYLLELERSKAFAKEFQGWDELAFPKYYEELSGKRVITMDWLKGTHLKEFLKTNPSQKTRNRLGQCLWKLYDHQIHELKKVQADPHPGNFLFREDGRIGLIDFGCVKEIPDDFYQDYVQLSNPQLMKDPQLRKKLFQRLGFYKSTDSEEEMDYFTQPFTETVEILSRPFNQKTFDFSQAEFFQEIFESGEKMGKIFSQKKISSARGPKDALYLNRTYYGLYWILHELQAEIKINSRIPTKIPDYISR